MCVSHTTKMKEPIKRRLSGTNGDILSFTWWHYGLTQIDLGLNFHSPDPRIE